jgi:hypothetical protein
MSSSKPINRAKPVIRAPRDTDTDKVRVARSTTTKMQTSPDWSAIPELQPATAAWLAVTDLLEANAKVGLDLRKQLAAVEATQRTHRRDWEAATQHVLALVGMHAKGSTDVVHGLGLDVRKFVPSGPMGAPSDLATVPGKELGEVVFTWSRGSARHGFSVQHALDPSDPVKIAAPRPCTRTKLVLPGMHPGGTVFLRVAAIDPQAPEGLGPWSDWITGLAR